MFEFIIGFFSVFHSIETDETMHSSSRRNINRNIVITIKDKKYSKNKIPWKGHFSADNFQTKSSKQKLKKIKKTLRAVISSLPQKHIIFLDDLEVKNQKHVSRGMANSHKMILNIGTIQSQEELAAIFLHEMGHIIDLGYLKGNKDSGISEFYDGETPIYRNDLSLLFYRISWKNSFNRKKGSLRSDFVSGYSLTNPFEDFAEHYIFYRLHGEKFRKLAKKSVILQKKYDFFKFKVFNGNEFQLKKIDNNFINQDIWDTTLLNYKIEKDLIMDSK